MGSASCLSSLSSFPRRSSSPTRELHVLPLDPKSHRVSFRRCGRSEVNLDAPALASSETHVYARTARRHRGARSRGSGGRAARVHVVDEAGPAAVTRGGGEHAADVPRAGRRGAGRAAVARPRPSRRPSTAGPSAAASSRASRSAGASPVPVSLGSGGTYVMTSAAGASASPRRARPPRPRAGGGPRSFQRGRSAAPGRRRRRRARCVEREPTSGAFGQRRTGQARAPAALAERRREADERGRDTRRRAPPRGPRIPRSAPEAGDRAPSEPRPRKRTPPCLFRVETVAAPCPRRPTRRPSRLSASSSWSGSPMSYHSSAKR